MKNVWTGTWRDAVPVNPEGAQPENALTGTILVQQFQNGQLSRGEVVVGLAAVFATATGSAAQSPGPPVAARTLNHVSISVADIKRSVDFYQSLFGMRIISQQGTGDNPIAGGDGSVVNLAPGAGPEFLGIYRGKPVGDIGHFCLGVQNFDADRVLAALQGRGVSFSPIPTTSACS